MFPVFEIPETIERDLLAFFKAQSAFPLANIHPRARPGDPLKAELSRHFGVYVLYYKGEFPLYSDLRDRNSAALRKPIYVGKAVSAGSRTGGKHSTALPAAETEVDVSTALAALDADVKAPQSNSLFKRLSEHATTIRRAETTLRVEDFEVRVVPMADALVQWAEAVMIKRLRPIWNAQISGFGNHDPGKGRYQQARSVWDQLHPGRTWAENLEKLATYDEQALRHVIQQTLSTDLDD